MRGLSGEREGDMKEFGNRLYTCLFDFGWTQKRLADETGITPVSIGRYINGQRTPKLSDAIRIADALCVSLDWLCGREEYSS
jgi:transcriptional regulator with XRE-family HTH domain